MKGYTYKWMEQSKDPDLEPHKNGHLIFYNEAKPIQ